MLSQPPGCHSPNRQVKQAHGLAVPSCSDLWDVFLIYPFLCDSVTSLKDQLIDLLKKCIMTTQPSTFHRIYVITYGPDVCNICHFLSYVLPEMKTQSESLEDSCNGLGLAPDDHPGPCNSQCLFLQTFLLDCFLGISDLLKSKAKKLICSSVNTFD